MNEPERQLRQRFKPEAERVLFENIRFDERFMQQVRDRIESEAGSRRTGTRFGSIRRKWIYGSVAAAMIAGVLLLLPLVLQDRPSDTGPVSPLAATNEPPVIQSTHSWQLQNAEEAKASFGKGMLVPSYVPEGVPLSGIHAWGVAMDEAAKVVFSYMYGEISFLIIEEKDAPAIGFHNFKSVDINGAQGYVKTGESDTELHWIRNGVHYAVTGQISEAEAVKIAKSMQ